MDNEQTVEFLGGPMQPAAEPAPLDPASPDSAPAAPSQWYGQWSPPAPEAGSRRRWRFLPRSLTARLVAGVLTIVVFVVLATGMGTYFALRSFLFQRLSQQLDSAAASAASSPCFTVAGRTTCNLDQAIRTGNHEWLGVLSASGATIPLPALNGEITSLTLSSALRSQIVADPGRHYSYTTSTGARLQITGAALRGSDAYVVLGLSTDDVENTLHQLVVKESLIGGAAVLIALFATAGGVQISLRRLRRVTATAREVAAELSPSGTGLDRRVPVDEDDVTEVGQLAESVNTLLAAVGTQFAARLESEQRMRQFMADASHELRTPLTSIRGYAELARMQRGLGSAAGDGEAADNLERIESEGTRMSRLVEDLLTLARGDQGGLPDMAPVDVSELLEDIVTSSRAAFPHRAIGAREAAGLSVVGDHDQLLRAVRNLVSNAATHTRLDGRIEVRAFASGPGVAIQVVDEGPGLPPDEAAHVFERFWRADKARTRARGGTGLGLAIVASIVQMHGGTVQFQSTVEDGSTVTVWLPARTG